MSSVGDEVDIIGSELPPVNRALLRAIILVALTLSATPASAVDPWIITGDVVVSEPMDVGDVIVVGGASLTVRDVGEPGFRVTGNLWAIGDGHVRLEGSVIQFLSTYNGQYALAGIDQALIEVVDCDYRIPNQVQHGLVIGGEGEMLIEGADFGDVQLVPIDTAMMTARRLNGHFEVVVQNDASVELTDIPRDEAGGNLWVWVEFPNGSRADYTPPMPGYVDRWTFPPSSSEGIVQNIVMERCQTLLWPMLVRENSHLTLRDIPEENWVVVGFHLPYSVVFDDLHNGRTYASTLWVFDRELTLIDASIDTWNLYPAADARVTVRDSVVGEILSFGDSRTFVERTTIDGSGGFLGARDSSQIILTDSVTTCTVEASNNSLIELHDSIADPYPQDPTGDFTRFGAYDRGRLLADQTMVNTTPAMGGGGVIGVTFIANPPELPPADPTVLIGYAAVFGLEGGPQLDHWLLEGLSRRGGTSIAIGGGEVNVENGELGEWTAEDLSVDVMLRTVLTDSLGRTLVGRHWVAGGGPRTRRVGSRRMP
jgi:hypothetical protein